MVMLKIGISSLILYFLQYEMTHKRPGGTWQWEFVLGGKVIVCR